MVMTVPTGECGRRHQHHRFVRHRDDSVEDRGLTRDSHRIACPADQFGARLCTLGRATTRVLPSPATTVSAWMDPPKLVSSCR